MQYENYTNARDLAWQILIEQNICELPVNVDFICEKMGIPIVPLSTLISITETYSLSSEELQSGSVMIIDNNAIIFVSEEESIERKRFTIAHELGHYLLKHAQRFEDLEEVKSEKEKIFEREANVFASRLLAPACVLWGCGVNSAIDIADLCQISKEAAQYRWERMKLIKERGKFLAHPLEKKVYEQFLPYIKSHKK